MRVFSYLTGITESSRSRVIGSVAFVFFKQLNFAIFEITLNSKPMASVKKLKKDIDYLIFEVISDCFTFGSVHPDENEEEVTGILCDAVSLRNDLIQRVNNPGKSDDQKAVKVYFQSVTKDLFLGIDELCKRLSLLAGKKK